jgi:hypothetical protein
MQIVQWEPRISNNNLRITATLKCPHCCTDFSVVTSTYQLCDFQTCDAGSRKGVSAIDGVVRELAQFRNCENCGIGFQLTQQESTQVLAAARRLITADWYKSEVGRR